MYTLSSVRFSSVSHSCLTLCDPMDYSMPGFSVHHHTQSFLKLMTSESVMPSNHLILHCSLLFLRLIFPSIRVFSNKSVLCIKWPGYCSFSFSMCPSNEYSGPISFRMNWLDLLAVTRVFSNTTVQKHQFVGAQLSLWSSSPIHT